MISRVTLVHTVTPNACNNGVPTCAPSCSNSCHPNACDIFTGTCNTGCPDGYLPPNCTLPLNITESDVPAGGWVGVGIASCVVLLLIVIAVVFLYRRKRIKHNQPARKSKVTKQPDNDPYDDPDESDHYDTIEPPKPYEREYAKSPSEQDKDIPDKQYDHLSGETAPKNDYAKVENHDNAKELEDDQSSKKSYTELEAESELNQYSYSDQSKNEKLGRLFIVSDYIDVI
uniref:Uncharacterized protein n=1 Tax=Biomphalaria glabrata TaxID=6526 RepID=A0A2C9KKU9_BIOGL